MLVSFCNISFSPTPLFCEGVLGHQLALIETTSSSWSNVPVMHYVADRLVLVLRWGLLLSRLERLNPALVLEKALKFRPGDWCLGYLVEGKNLVFPIRWFHLQSLCGPWDLAGLLVPALSTHSWNGVCQKLRLLFELVDLGLGLV